jgi:hypothetical protein
MPDKNPISFPPPVQAPAPFNIERVRPIDPSTQQTNTAYRKALEGTVWANYELVMTQWPLQANSPNVPASPPNTFPGTSVPFQGGWLPWLCAYSGARVNELTSLYPGDISAGPDGIWCMVIKPSLEKTEQWRLVPIHSHIIDQKDFLKYVEEREKLNKPLFYDPVRSRGGKPGNPQFKKVAERIGEWVHGLGIPVGVKPNHAWRHLFKSVARDVRMDREVEGFITGHRPKDSNAGNDYGDRWIRTMSAEIERYPRFSVAALDEPKAPHKRHRRTDAKVAEEKAAKEKRKAARSTRAIGTK